jgi:hypothetical protein
MKKKVVITFLLAVTMLLGVSMATANATPGKTTPCWKSGCHATASATPSLKVTAVAGHKLKITSTNSRYIAVYLGSVRKKITTSRSFTFQGVAGKTYTVVGVNKARYSHRISKKTP